MNLQDINKVAEAYNNPVLVTNASLCAEAVKLFEAYAKGGAIVPGIETPIMELHYRKDSNFEWRIEEKLGVKGDFVQTYEYKGKND